MKTKTFDKKFDNNEDVSSALETSKSKRLNREQRRRLDNTEDSAFFDQRADEPDLPYDEVVKSLKERKKI